MAGNPDGPDPTVHRRRLRSELRKAREAAGKTQREAAVVMDWSSSKLIRIETGAVTISTNDLRALLGFYEVPPERVAALVAMAKAAREPSAWNVFRDVVTPDFLSFLGYESSASVIRTFEPLVVPGLLQTEEYAREVISVINDDKSIDLVDALVDLRVQRQEKVFADSGASTHFIIDEAALRRPVGGPDAMERQLAHLSEVNEQSNVTIRIVPSSLGAYSAMRIGYTLFEFPDPDDEDVLYVESPLGDLLITENSVDEKSQNTPVVYLDIFNRLEEMALSEDTPAALEYLATQLRPDPKRSWGRPIEAGSSAPPTLKALQAD